MSDPILARLRDRLAGTPPYAGRGAEAYDAWIPVDAELEEEPYFVRLLERADGPVLELGCGTGRPLLRWTAAGYDVEGLDASADMLAILEQHAAERDLHPIVHHGDFAPLTLDRTYAAIVCMTANFSLIEDADRARQAVVSYFEHLRPGDTLAMTLAVPVDDFDEVLGWRIRRTGPSRDGGTIVVHEAIRCDQAEQLQVIYNRVETYDPRGELQDTWLRKLHLRWWTQPQAEALLVDAGFEDVVSYGPETGWIIRGRRPAL